MSNEGSGEITYQFLKFNGYNVDVWEWIRNFIPHFIIDVITYPCCDEVKPCYEKCPCSFLPINTIRCRRYPAIYFQLDSLTVSLQSLNGICQRCTMRCEMPLKRWKFQWITGAHNGRQVTHDSVHLGSTWTTQLWPPISRGHFFQVTHERHS